MTTTDSFGTYLKSERLRLGLTQFELGQAGGVDRRTQYKYENGTSQPSLGYLLGVQGAGVDVSFVLFGRRSANLPRIVDWALLWQAIEDVEIFISRHAPTCSSAIKREMVERLYTKCVESRSGDRSRLLQRDDRQRLLAAMWEEESGNTARCT